MNIQCTLNSFSILYKMDCYFSKMNRTREPLEFYHLKFALIPTFSLNRDKHIYILIAINYI